VSKCLWNATHAPVITQLMNAETLGTLAARAFECRASGFAACAHLPLFFGAWVRAIPRPAQMAALLRGDGNCSGRDGFKGPNSEPRLRVGLQFLPF